MKRVAFFRNLPNERQPLMEVWVCDREKCVHRVIKFDDAVDVKENEIIAPDLISLGYKECVFYDKVNNFFWQYRLQNNKPPFILSTDNLANCDLSRLTYIDKWQTMWVASMQPALIKELRENVRHILLSSGNYKPRMVDFRKVAATKRVYQELFKNYASTFGLGEDKIDVLQVPCEF